MKKVIRENKTILVLCFIIIMQMAVVLSFAAKKEGYFIDEVLTFSLANNSESHGYFKTPENSWINNEWYLQNMTVQTDEKFDFGIAYKNQEWDVSPPLFYMLIHGICSFFPGQLSHWFGIAMNLVFYIGCAILLYFLGKKIFKDEKVGLLIALLFGISYGAINSAIFIRMYMQATFFLLAHTAVYVHFLDQENIPTKGYFFLWLTSVLGCMTQYYFLIGAAFLGMWYGIKLLCKKRYVDIVKYVAAVGASAVTAYSFFPAMIRHILKSGRGVEALNSFNEKNSYFTHLRETFGILNSQMFAGKFWLLLVLLCVLAAFLWIKKKESLKFENYMWVPVVVVCIGYFLAVTKVAPYQTDRYLMPTYPTAYFLVVGAMYALLSKLFNQKKSFCVCLLLFGVLSVNQLLGGSFHYLYEGYYERNVAQEHIDANCVVLSEDHGYWYYDIQALSQYNSFYWLKEIENEEALGKMKERIEPAGEFILYVRNTWSEEEFKNFWDKNFDISWKYTLDETCTPERYVVYYCQKN